MESGVPAVRHVTTRRGAQDVAYRLRAVGVIEEYRRIYPQRAEPLEWLFRSGDRTGRTWRHSLLTELGRVDSAPRMMAIALRIAELKPRTKQGIRLVRQWRESLKASHAEGHVSSRVVDND